jgi:hypothetical protein
VRRPLDSRVMQPASRANSSKKASEFASARHALLFRTGQSRRVQRIAAVSAPSTEALQRVLGRGFGRLTLAVRPARRMRYHGLHGGAMDEGLVIDAGAGRAGDAGFIHNHLEKSNSNS